MSHIALTGGRAGLLLRKYRRNGTELAVITYSINAGSVTLVKNI